MISFEIQIESHFHMDGPINTQSVSFFANKVSALIFTRIMELISLYK